jgi:hypothetical protein
VIPRPLALALPPWSRPKAKIANFEVEDETCGRMEGVKK